MPSVIYPQSCTLSVLNKHFLQCHYAECQMKRVILLNAVMLSVIMLNVGAPILELDFGHR